MSPNLIPVMIIATIWLMLFWSKIAKMRRGPAAQGPRTCTLGGETLTVEDWRVTGTRKGARLTTYCTSHWEVIDARRHMAAVGYRGIKVRRVA